jgi:hypothetical protein
MLRYAQDFAVPTAMTPEERKEMNRLCLLIQDEKDHRKFTELIAQLNALLEKKEQRLNGIKPLDPVSGPRARNLQERTVTTPPRDFRS